VVMVKKVLASPCVFLCVAPTPLGAAGMLVQLRSRVLSQ